MAFVQDTLTPYAVLAHKGIKYGTCYDYDHISRYRRIRQVTHCPDDDTCRFVALETQNEIDSDSDMVYFEVPYDYENRLDLIAYKMLGSASYSWTIAYFNGIEDGYTVHAGTMLAVPKSISQLYNKGEILSSVSPYALNLGEE